ncbi:phage holin family protein [Actinocrinis puniceicyclus]|uniref:Phage holin family protein n=1 Tax=Actinocrinis puniceicyclus TaxID=977794 RepID=A0A8J8BEM0_9ACTN|nr:phage holin family protein [Actinocrinis puniceicyclus]MBS2965695.1 phage holin family protein [Actinocrinis puniceicyclus]
MSGTEAAATRLTRDTTALVREQVEQLTRELAGTVRDAGAGAVLLAGAGACGLLAVAAAHQTAMRALESMMPRPLAAVTLTVAYGAGAAAMSAAGMKKIKDAADASAEALAENRQDTVASDAPLASDAPFVSGAKVPPGAPS